MERKGKGKMMYKWCILVVVGGAFTGLEPRAILEQYTQVIFTIKEAQYAA